MEEGRVRLLTDFNELTKLRWHNSPSEMQGEVRRGHVGDRAPHGATWTGDGLESPRELGEIQTCEHLHHPSEKGHLSDLRSSTDLQ